MSLTTALDQILPQIETDLKEVLRIPHPDLAPYYGMMHYHLGWADEALRPCAVNGGKRLRPILCLLACEAAGGDPQQALPASSAVELIHAFSLVHDDIEDGSPLRRGRRTVWDVWGMPHALNVGDGLFVLARLALHRLSDRGVPAVRCQKANLAFDQACLALCEGQFFDMSFEARLGVDLDQYLWMIRHKTASLLATSAQLGATVATDDTALIGRCHDFGENLGMAFQIQDDILGTWGDEQVTGKSAATDIRDRKKTLPIVYALNHEDGDVRRRLADLYSLRSPSLRSPLALRDSLLRTDPKGFPKPLGSSPLALRDSLRSQPGGLDAAAVRSVLELLEQVGARQYAEEMAEEYYRLALNSLDSLSMAAADGSGCPNPLLSQSVVVPILGSPMAAAGGSENAAQSHLRDPLAAVPLPHQEGDHRGSPLPVGALCGRGTGEMLRDLAASLLGRSR